MRSLWLMLMAVVASGCSSFLWFHQEKVAVEEWDGSPYVRWRVPFLKEGRVVGLHRIKDGILVSLSRRRQVTKLAYVSERDGITQWIVPYSPSHLEPKTVPPYQIHGDTLLIIGEGPVLRAISLLTGEDLWDRGGCTSVATTRTSIWARCLDTTVVLDPRQGSILQELQGLGGSRIAAMDGAVIVLDGLRLYPSSEKWTVYLPKAPSGLVASDHLTLWFDDPPSAEVISPDGTTMTVELSERIGSFWHATLGNTLVLPISRSCIAGFDLRTKKRLWNSCGLLTSEMGAVVQDGLFMLSSQVEHDERAIIFVDAFNGLQTVLFNSRGEGGQETVTGVHIASGPNPSNTIFAVDSQDNLIAIRVAQ